MVDKCIAGIAVKRSKREGKVTVDILKSQESSGMGLVEEGI
jgi:hypothetical protein